MGVSANISPIEPRRAPAPRAGRDPAAPVVLVGQARSGSTLLTLMLNRGGDGFVVNDAYVLQLADSLGVAGGDRAASPRALARFRAACMDRLRARCVPAGPAPIHRSAIAPTAALARAAGADGDDWGVLWGDMLRIAGEGRALWGWNTPQDHLRIPEILAAFPRARFVFVMRDPYAMLRSYKALPGYWGRERARYHPALQGRAWAAALNSHARLAAIRPGQTHLLRFEDLLGAPAETLARLAGFLGAPIAPLDPASLPANGSDPAPGLSRAELWAARMGLGDAPARLGYAPPAPERLGGLDLLRCTLRAGGYYLGESLRSRDMRGRIRRLAAP